MDHDSETEIKLRKQIYCGAKEDLPFQCSFTGIRSFFLGTEVFALCYGPEEHYHDYVIRHVHVFDTISGKWRQERLGAYMPTTSNSWTTVLDKETFLHVYPSGDDDPDDELQNPYIRISKVLRNKNGKRIIEDSPDRKIVFDDCPQGVRRPSCIVMPGRPLIVTVNGSDHGRKVYIADDWIAGEQYSLTDDAPIHMRLVYSTKKSLKSKYQNTSIMTPSGRIFFHDPESGYEQALVVDLENLTEEIQDIGNDPCYGHPTGGSYYDEPGILNESRDYEWRIRFDVDVHDLKKETASWQRVITCPKRKDEHCAHRLLHDDEHGFFGVCSRLENIYEPLKGSWAIVSAQLQTPSLVEMSMRELRRTLKDSILCNIERATATEYGVLRPYEAAARVIAKELEYWLFRTEIIELRALATRQQEKIYDLEGRNDRLEKENCMLKELQHPVEKRKRTEV